MKNTIDMNSDELKEAIIDYLIKHKVVGVIGKIQIRSTGGGRNEDPEFEVRIIMEEGK